MIKSPGRMNTRLNELRVLIASTVLWGAVCCANNVDIAGDWRGAIAVPQQTLRSVLHVTTNSAGELSATFDSLDQGAKGIPCSNVVLTGRDLTFEIPIVHGHYKGEVSADGKTIRGIWNQGTPLPLDLTRQTDAPAKGAILAGDWGGSIQVPALTLHLALHVSTGSQGELSVVLDSLDQNAMGLPGGNVVLKGNDFSFEIPSVHGSYKGTVGADAKTIKGTWSQGNPVSLDFARQATPLANPNPA